VSAPCRLPSQMLPKTACCVVPLFAASTKLCRRVAWTASPNDDEQFCGAAMTPAAQFWRAP
jgi:hypothetical protein